MIDINNQSNTTGSQVRHLGYTSPYTYEVKETQKSINITLKEEKEDVFEYRDNRKDIVKSYSDNKTIAENPLNNHSYTISYIQHNTTTFLNRVHSAVDEWANTGTENSISSIAELRRIKDIYREYLNQEPIGRIVHSTLSLIFENNKWESIEITKVQKLAHILKSLISSDKSEDNVKNFVRELVRAKIDFTSA